MTGAEVVDRIDLLLEERGLKRQTLSLDLGVPQQTISNWKTRGNFPPSDILYAIGKYLGVTMEFLLSDDQKIVKTAKSLNRIRLANLIENMDEPDLSILLATAEAIEKRNSVVHPSIELVSQNTLEYNEKIKTVGFGEKITLSELGQSADNHKEQKINNK